MLGSYISELGSSNYYYVSVRPFTNLLASKAKVQKDTKMICRQEVFTMSRTLIGYSLRMLRGYVIDQA